ncbi:hypothetical protein MNBD_IGNAVI01-1265 [hydrothermal vent metagenome]|uniref:Uncharacterized protein n=1 Tax=hydrothermal vent metagenome TaxID=652676 RepID=A0A3B1CHZ5_9ZZZZ
MQKNMIYFVMYLVLIVELLIVITERDELDEKESLIRDKMLSTLAESYKQPLVLTIPQRTSDYNLKSKEPLKVVLTPVGVVSASEKKNLEFFINIDKKSRNKPIGWPKGGLTLINSTKNFKLIRENGNAVFIANFKKEGRYKFTAYCKLEHEFPDYLPPYLLDSLKVRVGVFKVAKSNTEKFSVRASTIGGVKKKRAEISF